MGDFDYQNRSVQWDAQGRPYMLNYTDERGRPSTTGRVRYISPAEVHSQNSYGQDPRLAAWAKTTGPAPGQSYLRERGQWNQQKGQWDQGINTSNLLSTAVGGLIAGPAIVSAFGPGAAAPATVPTAANTTAPLLVNTAAPWTATLPAAAPFGEAAIPVATGLEAGLPYAAPVVNNLLHGPDVIDGPGYPGTDSNPLDSSGNTGGNTGGNNNGLSLPSNLLDYAKLGAAGIQQALAYLANQGASEAQLQAAKDALDFAKRAYDEQNAKEQARFDATEARRVPYRQASRAALKELRRVLGIEEEV